MRDGQNLRGQIFPPGGVSYIIRTLRVERVAPAERLREGTLPNMDPKLLIAVEPNQEEMAKSELEELVLELQSEIQSDRLTGFQIDETHRQNPDALGPEWVPILTAVVSSHLAVEVTKGLVSIIRDWLARRKPVQVTIKGPRGDYTITGDHLSGPELEKIALKVVGTRTAQPAVQPKQ